MRRPTDQELDLTIAGMLQVGVTLAAVVVLAGGVLWLSRSSGQVPDYAHFHAADRGLSTVGGILRGAAHRQATSLMQLGLLLLVATPVVRVGFCIVGFARQRDWLYVAVSSGVLLILFYALTSGSR
jgi:uncharacterized membrane protein